MARRFLYVIAGLIMLGLAGAFGWTLFRDELMRVAFTPSVAFSPPRDRDAPDYAGADAWLSRPGQPNDPADWVPKGFAAAREPAIAAFFVPPTAYLSRARWTAPLHDPETEERLRLFTAGEASAFNGVAAIWAPRYRQATVGAFLAHTPDTQAAIDFAYGDVLAAFDAFLKQIGPDQPILLAGHSQGSLHLMRLMRDRIAGTPLAQRIVAAYLVGWPISLEADLPALGLPACEAPGQTSCVLSWQSFAEASNGFGQGTDYSQIRAVFDATTGLAGRPRKGTAILCTNPLTGAPNTAALASANKGALLPNAALSAAELVPGKVPARCDASGFLLIGPPPEGYGRYVLPGQNYHVFDYALFWGSIRADAEARAARFLASRR